MCSVRTACQIRVFHCFYTFVKPAIQHSHLLHNVIGQLCWCKKVRRFGKTLKSSFIPFVTQLFMALFMCPVECRRQSLLECPLERLSVHHYRYHKRHYVSHLSDARLFTLPLCVAVKSGIFDSWHGEPRLFLYYLALGVRVWPHEQFILKCKR